MDLQAIRVQIDEVDKDLVKLLEKRMKLVSQVVAYKQEKGVPVLDRSREEVILDRVAGRVDDDQYRYTIRKTFESILAHSRDFQAQVLSQESVNCE